jgi:hypothetical protein
MITVYINCFNIFRIFILATHCIYVFFMIITINSDYLSKELQQVSICNEKTLCFLRHRDRILKY